MKTGKLRSSFVLFFRVNIPTNREMFASRWPSVDPSDPQRIAVARLIGGR